MLRAMTKAMHTSNGFAYILAVVILVAFVGDIIEAQVKSATNLSIAAICVITLIPILLHQKYTLTKDESVTRFSPRRPHTRLNC